MRYLLVMHVEILCAIVSVLFGCTNIFVILLQTAVLRVGGYSLFSMEYVFLHIFTIIS